MADKFPLPLGDELHELQENGEIVVYQSVSYAESAPLSEQDIAKLQAFGKPIPPRRVAFVTERRIGTPRW